MTLAAAALSEEAVCFMEELIDRLTPSEELAGQQAYYRLARAQFGRHMRFADLTTALWAASTLIRPSAHPESGGARGRSLRVLGAPHHALPILGLRPWLPACCGLQA